MLTVIKLDFDWMFAWFFVDTVFFAVYVLLFARSPSLHPRHSGSSSSADRGVALASKSSLFPRRHLIHCVSSLVGVTTKFSMIRFDRLLARSSASSLLRRSCGVGVRTYTLWPTGLVGPWPVSSFVAPLSSMVVVEQCSSLLCVTEGGVGDRGSLDFLSVVRLMPFLSSRPHAVVVAWILSPSDVHCPLSDCTCRNTTTTVMPTMPSETWMAEPSTAFESLSSGPRARALAPAAKTSVSTAAVLVTGPWIVQTIQISALVVFFVESLCFHF